MAASSLLKVEGGVAQVHHAEYCGRVLAGHALTSDSLTADMGRSKQRICRLERWRRGPLDAGSERGGRGAVSTDGWPTTRAMRLRCALAERGFDGRRGSLSDGTRGGVPEGWAYWGDDLVQKGVPCRMTCWSARYVRAGSRRAIEGQMLCKWARSYGIWHWQAGRRGGGRIPEPGM